MVKIDIICVNIIISTSYSNNSGLRHSLLEDFISATATIKSSKL